MEFSWLIHISITCSMLLTVGAEANTRHTEHEGASPSSAELKLLERLMSHYNGRGTNSRPVVNSSNAVPVKFGLGLIQMDLNEKDNILSLSMWTRYSWVDEYLMWDPAEHNGVTSLRLRDDQIWIPDIMLYNTANVDKESRDALVVAYPDGTVNWYPHSIFRSACSVDVTDYPFDIQKCNLVFGSWTYPFSQFDLNVSFPGGVDLSTYQNDYKESSRWEVVNVTATRVLLPENDPDPIVVLYFEMFMRRRMVFSTYMLTLPCVFLACLTLVVFSLPPERPDRTALAMNTFASFMVLLLILVDGAMPTTSSVPRLGIYYCFNLVIIMIAVVLSTIVVNISRPKPGKRAPRWLSCFSLQLMARLVLYGEPARQIRKQKAALPLKDRSRTGSIGSSRGKFCPLARKQAPEEEAIQEKLSNGSVEGYKQDGAADSEIGDIRRSLQRIEMRMEERLTTQRRDAVLALEWRCIGQVWDRFFFVVYFLMIIFSLVIFFPRPTEEFSSIDS